MGVAIGVLAKVLKGIFDAFGMKGLSELLGSTPPKKADTPDPTPVPTPTPRGNRPGGSGPAIPGGPPALPTRPGQSVTLPNGTKISVGKPLKRESMRPGTRAAYDRATARFGFIPRETIFDCPPPTGRITFDGVLPDGTLVEIGTQKGKLGEGETTEERPHGRVLRTPSKVGKDIRNRKLCCVLEAGYNFTVLVESSEGATPLGEANSTIDDMIKRFCGRQFSPPRGGWAQLND